jgi:hypothetical protein
VNILKGDSAMQNDAVLMDFGASKSVRDLKLITNNANLRQYVSSQRFLARFLICFVEGSSLDVLITVRDAVHLGACLLTHPLYGNLRPHQQPFRSVLIKENPGSLVDRESRSMIVDAVLLYRSCENNPLLPGNLTNAARDDYAFVDAELMRESLTRYGSSRPWGE